MGGENEVGFLCGPRLGWSALSGVIRLRAVLPHNMILNQENP